MKRNLYLAIALMIKSGLADAQHPFKFDHTVYQTVYLNKAFHLMDSLSNYLLLDVRTPGEYGDSSRTTALNIGRLKGSVNLTVDSVPAHMEELKKYINQPVFVYCSHSQRSRRVSKLLAENGFTKVYNINGGMTQLNESDADGNPDKSRWLISRLTYRNISSKDAYHLIADTPGLVIIDIRSAAEFASMDSLSGNNIGRLKNAINIPQSVFKEKFDSLRISSTRAVLLYDLRGYNSMDVTGILSARGFTRIYNLFEGLEGFMADHYLDRLARSQLFADEPAYRLLDVKSSIDLLMKQPELVILDTRPDDEFNNKSKKAYLNLGHMKGAIHINSVSELQTLMGQKNKSSEFLVYGSGSDEAALVCVELINNGYGKVNCLSQGLYHFVWSTANAADCIQGRAYLSDHEGLY